MPVAFHRDTCRPCRQRKDIIREQKKAGTHRKAHKRKQGGGADSTPAAPPSDCGPAAQRPRPAGQGSAEPASDVLPPDPYDYSSVDYSKFGRPEGGQGQAGRARGRGGKGRGRGGRDARGTGRGVSTAGILDTSIRY